MNLRANFSAALASAFAALVPVCFAAACKSSKPEPEPEPAGLALPADPRAGPPLVTGTVVDAATGAPVQGAKIVGPAGASAESGADGRFRLSGLSYGAEGDLVATAGERSGRVRLRPLAGGRLEVVVHLR